MAVIILYFRWVATASRNHLHFLDEVEIVTLEARVLIGKYVLGKHDMKNALETPSV
jgi:hypothetical protein